MQEPAALAHPTLAGPGGRGEGLGGSPDLPAAPNSAETRPELSQQEPKHSDVKGFLGLGADTSPQGNSARLLVGDGSRSQRKASLWDLRADRPPLFLKLHVARFSPGVPARGLQTGLELQEPRETLSPHRPRAGDTGWGARQYGDHAPPQSRCHTAHLPRHHTHHGSHGRSRDIVQNKALGEVGVGEHTEKSPKILQGSKGNRKDKGR